MNEKTPRIFGGKPLLPHQKAVLDKFFEQPSNRGHVVRWDMGLGSAWMTAHLIKHFLATKPVARVLVLSPKVLALQTKHHLASVGVPAESVDRFRYRTMRDAASLGTSIWHEGGVFILGMDFAKQDDIVQSLCSVPWTLLVVPMAHELRGLREDVVRELVESSPEVRLLLLTIPGPYKLPTFGIESWAESTVRQAEVVDAFGQRIFDLPPISFRSVEIQPDALEHQLRNAVTEVVQLLAATSNTLGPQSSIFEQSRQSSVSALEEVLRRLRNRLAHGDIDAHQTAEEQDEETDADDLPLLSQTDNRKLLVAVDRCLNELDLLAGDSKLEWLIQLLQDARANAKLPQSMCILTKYRATLFYVQTALEDLGFSIHALHGELSYDGRFEVARGFQEQGGILLATTAIMTEGVTMPKVESLVFYDSPRSRLMLQQVLGRFQRFGRTTPLSVVAVNGEESVELFREILSTK